MATSTEQQIWNLAREAANAWYRLAVQQPGAIFYLWWRTARPQERIAPLVAASTAPSAEYRQSIQLSGAWSTDLATRKIAEAMMTLPILGHPSADQTTTQPSSTE